MDKVWFNNFMRLLKKFVFIGLVLVFIFVIEDVGRIVE